MDYFRKQQIQFLQIHLCKKMSAKLDWNSIFQFLTQSPLNDWQQSAIAAIIANTLLIIDAETLPHFTL